jgi:hypothetical protein
MPRHIKLGIAMGGGEVPFDLADVRTPRSRRKATPKAASLSLGEVARIAEHMHAVRRSRCGHARFARGRGHGMRRT